MPWFVGGVASLKIPFVYEGYLLWKRRKHNRMGHSETTDLVMAGDKRKEIQNLESEDKLFMEDNT